MDNITNDWPRCTKNGITIPAFVYIEAEDVFVPCQTFGTFYIHDDSLLAACLHCQAVWRVKRSKNWWRCPNSCWKQVVNSLKN